MGCAGKMQSRRQRRPALRSAHARARVERRGDTDHTSHRRTSSGGSHQHGTPLSPSLSKTTASRGWSCVMASSHWHSSLGFSARLTAVTKMQVFYAPEGSGYVSHGEPRKSNSQSFDIAWTIQDHPGEHHSVIETPYYLLPCP